MGGDRMPGPSGKDGSVVDVGFWTWKLTTVSSTAHVSETSVRGTRIGTAITGTVIESPVKPEAEEPAGIQRADQGNPPLTFF